MAPPKLGELRRAAAQAGLDEDAVNGALDEGDPRAALSLLLVEAEEMRNNPDAWEMGVVPSSSTLMSSDAEALGAAAVKLQASFRGHACREALARGEAPHGLTKAAIHAFWRGNARSQLKVVPLDVKDNEEEDQGPPIPEHELEGRCTELRALTLSEVIQRADLASVSECRINRVLDEDDPKETLVHLTADVELRGERESGWEMGIVPEHSSMLVRCVASHADLYVGWVETGHSPAPDTCW